jgi:hypothetical protein
MQGSKMSLNVTAPFGGGITMPCPRNSPWSIRIEFPPRCVHASVMMQLQGVEAGNLDAVKCAFGNILSPVVEVRPRQDVQCFKAYRLVIPHRANSTKQLALYFWPDNRSGAERILQNVTFDDDYCTAEVEGFGLYAVVAMSAGVQEIIYAKLVFAGERRDVTGRQLVPVQMSTNFQGVVYAYPKAFLEPPSGMPMPTSSQWMTMPRFQVNPVTHFERVQVQFAGKMQGCKVTSWSGRAKWRNRPLMMKFEAIVQPVPGQTFGDKTPIVPCNCSLIEDGSEDQSIKFAGPHFFRMQILVLLLLLRVGRGCRTRALLIDRLLLWARVSHPYLARVLTRKIVAIHRVQGSRLCSSRRAGTLRHTYECCKRKKIWLISENGLPRPGWWKSALPRICNG